MKGSTWHRWDLHYHTPSSHDYYKKDKTNEEIVKELLADSVEAVVVTDHHKIDFKRIENLNLIADNRIKFFRGIEVISELGGKESVHFIAIFPDSLAEDQIRDGFLVPLGITEEGINRDKTLLHKPISYQNFLKYAKKLGAIVSVHAGKKANSIENIANCSITKQLFKEELLRSVDILETSKKEDIDDYNTIVFPAIKKRQPIVVCSDYHAEFNYREYRNGSNPTELLKRDATWIKADITFEGLKQIVFEPDRRVKVQENNPASEKTGLKIEHLKIENSKLFRPQDLSFNGDMIAIIGEKGSGKTALLDMVAHSLGEKGLQKSSFLNRAASELSNSFITFNMYGDDPKTIPYSNEKTLTRCTYINPSKLSSFCENDGEMQKFIKSILINDEIEKEQNDIAGTNLEIQSNILRIDAIDGELENKELIKKKIEELEEKIQIEAKNKPLLPAVDKTSGEKFTQLCSDVEEKRKKLDSLTEVHGRLFWFNTNREDLLVEKINCVREDLYKYLPAEFDSEKFAINARYDENTVKYLIEKERELNEKKNSLKTELDETRKEHTRLKNEIFKSNELQERYEKWEKYIQELRKELTEWKGREKDVLEKEKLRTEMLAQCCDLYAENIRRKKQINKYYHDLKTQLSEQIDGADEKNGKNKITFEPIIKIKEEDLFAELETILSLKAVSEDFLKKAIDNKYRKAIDKFMEQDNPSKEEIEDMIELFVSEESKKNMYGRKIDEKIFKGRRRKIDLYKVAFKDFITINYEISFNSIPMDQLSSGQKGIVLLKLLLRLDQSRDPLLIDQPEDNLDNKSVYDQLVEEFKIIKQKRQLLIATHNPNLVINTDAEQIIVAEYRKGSKEGYISYESGAIENPSIRDKICKILEGGEAAFVNREKRYNFDIK